MAGSAPRHKPGHGHGPPHSPPRHGHVGHGPGHGHGPSHSPPRHGHGPNHSPPQHDGHDCLGPAHSPPKHGHLDKHGNGDCKPKPKPKPGDGCSNPSGGNVQVITIPVVVDDTTTGGGTTIGPTEQSEPYSKVVGLSGDEAKKIIEQKLPGAVVIVITMGERGPSDADETVPKTVRLWLDPIGNVQFVTIPEVIVAVAAS